MALELGLQALKAIYELAKMIKEAKDNVILVNGKLETTQSIEEVIELQVKSIGSSLPEDILCNLRMRLVTIRRISRRMKLKYQPLIAILEQLGGASATIKSMSSRLSKGVLSAAMALSCLSTIMRRNTDREAARSSTAFLKKLTNAGLYLNEEFCEEVLADPNGYSENDFSKAAQTSSPSRSSIDAWLVFKSQSSTIVRISAALDVLDKLVVELEAQDELLKDDLDHEGGDGGKHSMARSLFPVHRGKSKSKKLPKGDTSEVVRGSSKSGSSTDALRKRGAQLLLNEVLCSTDADNLLIDEAKLGKAMAECCSPERLKFLVRQLGEFQDKETMTRRAISRERFEQFLLKDGEKNAGFNIAIIGSALLDVLDLSELPTLMQEAGVVTTTVIKPLINYSLAFGLLFQSEGMREGVQDDPDEIAALQAEADEKSLVSQMSMFKNFAVYYAESYEYNLAPDASLLLSIAIDAGESKYGLGPSTRRRLELLFAILSICNIEADKITIEQVEADLKSELNLLTSLGSSSMNEKISDLHKDIVESAFDARRLLKGNAAEFWVSAFGKSIFDVQWARFKSAFLDYHSLPVSDRDMKRLQFLLLDTRGNVTIEHFKALTNGAGGSIAKVMKSLGSLKQLPENISQVIAPLRPKTAEVTVAHLGVGAVGRASSPQATGAGGGGGGDTLSPSQKRQHQLRISGAIRKAQASEA